MEETVKSPVEEEKLPAEEQAAEEKTAVEEEKQEPEKQVEKQPGKKAEDVKPPRGSRYEQISTFGFIGIILLMGIPVIGPILMIVWALGGCRKQQKRSFARAKLILSVIGLILSFVMVYTTVQVVDAMVTEIGEKYGVTSMEEAGRIMEAVEGVMSGNLNEESQKLIGDMIGNYIENSEEDLSEVIGTYLEGSEEVVGEVLGTYIGSTAELNEEEQQQLNDAVNALVKGEITIEKEELDWLLEKIK